MLQRHGPWGSEAHAAPAAFQRTSLASPTDARFIQCRALRRSAENEGEKRRRRFMGRHRAFLLDFVVKSEVWTAEFALLAGAGGVLA